MHLHWVTDTHPHASDRNDPLCPKCRSIISYGFNQSAIHCPKFQVLQTDGGKTGIARPICIHDTHTCVRKLILSPAHYESVCKCYSGKVKSQWDIFILANSVECIFLIRLHTRNKIKNKSLRLSKRCTESRRPCHTILQVGTWFRSFQQRCALLKGFISKISTR